MDLKIATFRTNDGLKLHYEQWTPPSPKAGIILVHGVGDHCGRYRAFVEHFTAQGYKVCLYDQRGHGRSPGRRVYAKRFEMLLQDLQTYAAFCQQEPWGARHPMVNGGIPWYLVGHSLGGQIVLNFLARTPGLFRAACTSSPNIEIAMTMPAWQEKVGRLLLAVWPTWKLKDIAKPDLLSHDPAVIADYKKDPLAYPYVTIGIGNEIIKNLETLFQLPPKIETPLLMLHGSADQYCSPSGTKRFFNDLTLAEKQLKIYDDCYHELFNETRKGEVFHDVQSWFERFA